MKSTCGCTDDSLCDEAKKLWKRKNSAGRKLYSYHRMKALGMLDEVGKPKHNGMSIMANNFKNVE